jgi:hypothetical protein
MQLVIRNWANFQLHVSHVTGNQLHKTVAKCQISSSVFLSASLVCLSFGHSTVVMEQSCFEGYHRVILFLFFSKIEKIVGTGFFGSV